MKIMDLITRPAKFFEALKDRSFKLWIPAVVVLLYGILDSVAVSIVEADTSLNEILGGGFPIVRLLFLVLGSNLMFYAVLTAQVFLFPVILKKLGGSGGSRRHSFYILGMATLPILIQSIIHLMFPATIWWQYFENRTLLYFLSYSLFNVFNIWSVALLIIGFSKVFNVSYKKASILYVQFLVKLIPLVIIKLLTS